MQRTDTLADLQGWVMAAENAGGGWVHIVFHKLEDDCGNSPNCIPPSLLRDFVAWLAHRKALGTVVKTHQEVILGNAATPVDLPNPSLESDGDGDGAPDCWQVDGAESPGAGRMTGGHTGTYVHRLELPRTSDGPRALSLSSSDVACAPAALPNHRYRITFGYRSDVHPRAELSYRTAAGAWRSWARGPHLAGASDWTQATWDAPPLPADAVALRVGVVLDQAGSVEVDDFALLNAGVPVGDTLLVVSPNGGETVSPGDELAVEWATVGQVPEVDVAYSVDQGTTWVPIGSALDSALPLSWSVPPLPGVWALVRVVSAANGAVSDVSDAPFLIGEEELPLVESPSGGTPQVTDKGWPEHEEESRLRPGGCSQSPSLPLVWLVAL
ncbi:MAG: polysaccharide deacetylase, partial [Myxococcaceae bacterium]|nr:polysaccharide deacetylase [Myxococcaceae bacterium]